MVILYDNMCHLDNLWVAIKPLYTWSEVIVVRCKNSRGRGKSLVRGINRHDVSVG